MLNKQLSRAQWLSLVILFIGVSVVQLQEQDQQRAAGARAALPSPSAVVNMSLPSTSVTGEVPSKPMRAPQNALLGITAVVIACVLSGFSGVYFEKILKSGDEVSLWMRNIQLAVLSVPIAYAGVVVRLGQPDSTCEHLCSRCKTVRQLRRRDRCSMATMRSYGQLLQCTQSAD
jgi:UDP-sugar transporter A1/2/3